MPLAIQDARIQAAEIASRTKLAKSHPDFSAPRRKLSAAISTAHRLGYFGQECDARLALAEIERRENPSVARAHLAEVARTARQHGIKLVARKAIALQNTQLAAR